MTMRDYVDYKVVCKGCGKEWESRYEWLEMDECMPDRGGYDGQ